MTGSFQANKNDIDIDVDFKGNVVNDMCAFLLFILLFESKGRHIKKEPSLPEQLYVSSLLLHTSVKSITILRQ